MFTVYKKRKVFTIYKKRKVNQVVLKHARAYSTRK